MLPALGGKHDFQKWPGPFCMTNATSWTVKRRDGSYVGHPVRYNRSFTRSVRLSPPTNGYFDGSQCGKICSKIVPFLPTASLDRSFWHFIKDDCSIALTTMRFVCALPLFLCALMSLRIFFCENLGSFFEICFLPRQEE